MYAVVDVPTSEARAHSCQDCDVREVSICAALRFDELDELEHLAQTQTYDPRATLFREGDDAAHVYNITKGMLRLSRLLTDGRRQVLGFVLPGEFLGLSLSDRQGFTAETVSAVEACRFERKAFIAYVEKKPHLLRSRARADGAAGPAYGGGEGRSIPPLTSPPLPAD